jgi:O-antigen/teichoic acid export membrane protein
MKNKKIMNVAIFVFEPLLRMVSGVFIGLYAARYIGPQSYGELSLVILVVTIGLSLGKFGVDGAIVRELVKNQSEDRDNILKAGFLIVSSCSFFVYNLIVVMVFFFLSGEVFFETALYGIILLIQGANVVEQKFQALENNKPAVLVRILCLSISSLATIFVIINELDVIFLYIIPVTEKVIQAVLYFILNKKYPHDGGVEKRAFSTEQCFKLAKISMPFFLTSVVHTMQTRIDQVVVTYFLTVKELGVYSIATKLYEAWSSLPYLIAVALLPGLILLKKNSDVQYYRHLSKLMCGSFWFFMVAAVLSYPLIPFFIATVMGAAYLEAILPLQILMFSTPFIALGTLGIRHLVVIELEGKIVKRTIGAFFLLVVSSLVLIPKYGIVGGALSIFFCSIVINVIFDFTDNKTKHLGLIKFKSIFFIGMKSNYGVI